MFVASKQIKISRGSPKNSIIFISKQPFFGLHFQISSASCIAQINLKFGILKQQAGTNQRDDIFTRSKVYCT